MPTLSREEIDRFIQAGFVRVDEAFPRRLADRCRAILWEHTGCDPRNRATWTHPVIRLGGYAQEPFRMAVNAPLLQRVWDDLVGAGRWLPRSTLGTFPVRFPTPADPGDTGWHVDAGFPGECSRPDDYQAWRVNVHSRGRALLMLFLFSDVEECDAPTRIAIGSHLEVARTLEPYGDAGVTVDELAAGAALALVRDEGLATGAAGTVYLCHPFVVHAAQKHRGNEPRFMAQPPLVPSAPLRVFSESHPHSPVERAIRMGLGLDPQGRSSEIDLSRCSAREDPRPRSST